MSDERIHSEQSNIFASEIQVARNGDREVGKSGVQAGVVNRLKRRNRKVEKAPLVSSKERDTLVPRLCDGQN